MTLPTKKKLLVLDLNGMLVETFRRGEKRPKHRPPDGKIGKISVYRRPYCNEFLTFCFENFEVGIWSSAQECKVQSLVDFIFGDLKNELVFSWHQCDCTNTGLKTLENKWKPVFLKELYKLWDKLKLDLPREKGDYGPSNTLLIDDTPYKAMRNPPHTAIFPYPYKVSNEPDDVLGGPLLKYLEGNSAATNVQQYVECHPFGQPPIGKESPNWNFYQKILVIRLPTVNQNSSSVVRTKMNGVANKALTSIAYNNGATQSSSIQEGSVPSIGREKESVTKAKRSKKKKRMTVVQSVLSQEHEAHNLPLVKKEAALGISQPSDIGAVSKDNVLSETAGTCMIERNDAVTTLSQKHATLNGLEENGVNNATKIRKKKREWVMQTAVNQEHGAHNISPVIKESAFGIPQWSDLDMISKDDGLIQTAATCTTERNGAIITTLSQQHASPNGLEENGVSEAIKPKKKNRKRKSAMQSASTQEHGARNISLEDKEAAFGISQQADLHMVPKDDDLSETAVTFTKERNGVMVTTLSQKRASLNGLEENGVDKASRSKKEKRKTVRDAALSQEHGVHNISPVENEADFAISQQFDLNTVSKGDGLSETAVTCMEERNGAIVTNLSEKRATHYGLEESGVAKAKKPRKKKRKSGEQPALNQEHGAHNISPGEKEVAFGDSQEFDLHMASKEDGFPKTAMTCTAERHSAMVTTSSQKHSTLNGLDESGAAKATKPGKKKRKGLEHAAFNQEHGARNISLEDKEAAFGIFEQADLHMVPKDDDLSETAVTFTKERNGVTVTTLSQKCASLNGLEENGVDKASRSKKEKRKSVMDAALSQEHGVHNISPVENEADFAISQQFDLNTYSKGDGLSETTVTCMKVRNGAIVSNLSEKHATHNRLEESGVAKAKKPGKKKRKSGEQPALNQERGAHNISPGEKEAAFGDSQEFDLDTASKEDGFPKTVMTCTAERHSAMVTTSSQKHSTLSGLEESGAAKATKPGKKKRKGLEQAAFNQEHGAHSKSWTDKGAAFSISQQSDIQMVSKGDGLPETAVTCLAGRHGAIVSTSSSAAKAAKPGKKKRKSAEQAASNQEHGAHNISLVEEEAAFGISQNSDLDPVSKEDDLFETTMTCTTERHGAIVTTLSQKHAILNRLVESDAAKATEPRKKKRKAVEQAALNQEHGAHNISLLAKEVVFGISQQSDRDLVSKEDGLPGKAVTFTAGRHGAIVTTLSQKHATLNGLEERGVANATKLGKKKRKGAGQAALNQERGAHNLSLMDEAAFGIPQRFDLDVVSKDDDLFETSETFTTERNGASITTVSQQHATLNRLEENGVARATKLKKKKSSVMQALNQEHGAHNIPWADKDGSFGISQDSDLHMVSEEDCLPETAMSCMAERHGSIVTTLSQKRATCIGLEESGASRATKPRKKKRKSVEQAALNQEPGAHNIS